MGKEISADKLTGVNAEFSGTFKLGSYANTRNDGQISSNRTLGTDALGNLKMYTIATSPAPYLEVLVPDSTLPSTTTNFTLKGAFFTPAMTVAIAGQTINYITFKSDNLVLVNVTTGATEGLFSVTLNNGIQAVFPNALMIVLGTVFKPLTSEWILTQPIRVENDQVFLVNYNSLGIAEWNKIIDYTKNFSIRVSFRLSPLGDGTIANYHQGLQVLRVSDNYESFCISPYSGDTTVLWSEGSTMLTGSPKLNSVCELRVVNGSFYYYVNNVLRYTGNKTLTENLKIRTLNQRLDMYNIKYIELP
jgi:hypothetical protein